MPLPAPLNAPLIIIVMNLHTCTHVHVQCMVPSQSYLTHKYLCNLCKVGIRTGCTQERVNTVRCILSQKILLARVEQKIAQFVERPAWTVIL